MYIFVYRTKIIILITICYYKLIRKYQETKDYPLDLIDFYDLQDVAEEYQENHRRDDF